SAIMCFSLSLSLRGREYRPAQKPARRSTRFRRHGRLMERSPTHIPHRCGRPNPIYTHDVSEIPSFSLPSISPPADLNLSYAALGCYATPGGVSEFDLVPGISTRVPKANLGYDLPLLIIATNWH